MMKYSINHHWKFSRFKVAFTVGCLQFILALFTQIVSIMIILSTETYIDIVKDFVALMVVNEIDNHLF